jgi:hypothetical protein
MTRLKRFVVPGGAGALRTLTGGIEGLNFLD